MAGVLTPLFALRSEKGLGIGDVATLREFIVWAREIGFGVVQLLPINEVGRDNSPYNAISAMAIEPMTLHLAPGSPEELTLEAFERVTANENLAALRRGPVKYERVRKLKRELLERAFGNFQLSATANRRSAFEEFCDHESSWLKPYSFFRALMEINRESETWDEWKREHRDPQTAHSWLAEQSPEMRAQFSARERFFCYAQWIADEQWRELRKFADENGVALMGDIPFGISYYSADVFTERNIFHLDWSGGAPPEPYFKDDQFTIKWGQNWGIPVYDWPAMRAQELERAGAPSSEVLCLVHAGHAPRRDQPQHCFQLDQQSVDGDKRGLALPRAVDLAVDAIEVADFVWIQIHAHGNPARAPAEHRFGRETFRRAARKTPQVTRRQFGSVPTEVVGALTLWPKGNTSFQHFGAD